MFQVSGVSEVLAEQNLTLLVPSSAAVAKMSVEDTNFWTWKGNLASLVRLQLDQNLGWTLSPRLDATVCPQEPPDPRSPPVLQPGQPDLSDLPPEDSTSCLGQRRGESTAARRTCPRGPAALTFCTLVLPAAPCGRSRRHHGRHRRHQRADPHHRPGDGGRVRAGTRRPRPVLTDLLCVQVLVPDRKLSEGLLATLALRPEFSLFRSYLTVRRARRGVAAGDREALSVSSASLLSLEVYNLSEEIQQAAEFTVFAPTDAAVRDHLRRTSAAALVGRQPVPPASPDHPVHRGRGGVSSKPAFDFNRTSTRPVTTW